MPAAASPPCTMSPTQTSCTRWRAGGSASSVLPMTVDWQVRAGSATDLDLVRPLWVAVHLQHVKNMPQLAPYVSDDETWRVRRALYEELLGKPDTLLLLAFVGETAIGY